MSSRSIRLTATTLVGLSLSAAASAQTTIDAGSADVQFDGEPTTAFGEAMVIVPDLDGDGVQDIAVGELAFDPIDGKGFPINNAGAVAVHSGADGTLIRRFMGDERDGNLGGAIVAIPDLDGDGVVDLAVGAPRIANGLVPEAGGVVLFSGGTGQILGRTLGPFGERTNFGSSLALVGDLNGDGRPEMIAGASGTGASSPASPGHAALIDGADGTILSTFDGSQAGSIFGASVAGGGDLDGDGVPDFVVGAPLHDVTTEGGDTYLDAGQVVLYSGADGSVIRPIWHDAGDFDSAKANFGTSVAIIGDIDGDGKDDLVAGGPESQQGSGGNGFVTAYSGVSGAIIHDIEGAFATGEQHGVWVAGVGDMDGDGTPDFAAASSQLCFGFCSSRPGEVITYSGATGEPLSVITGENDGDSFGFRFAAGDLDGDGGIDLAAAAPFHGSGGRGYILMGTPVVPACPSDVDGSGTVDFADLVSVLGAFGPCPDCPEDIDASGVVDFTDVVTLLADWGTCG